MKAIQILAVSALALLAGCGPETRGVGTDSVKIDSSQPKELQAINMKLRQDPNNLDLYHERAKYYIGKKQYKEASADMQRVLNIDSSKTVYLMTTADLCFFQNKTGRSKQLLERVILLDEKNTEARLRLAQLYVYTDQYQRALNQLDSTLMINQNIAEAYFIKGMVFKKTGDTAKAVSSLQTAVDLDPEYYNAFIQLGILFAEKKSKLAEEYYQDALKIKPGSDEAMYNLAKYYQDIGEINRALDGYTALLKVYPSHFDAHFNLGVLHTQQLKMYDEGIKYFNLAMQDNPHEPRAFYGRGFCYEMKGDANKAIEDYRQALVIDPGYENARISIDRILKGEKAK
ncbi:MAG: hypothetical protein FD123_2724 [Bacteroidetes bacterium]|nr:MAG: hypothetical protein FD123_2724 [Bacteroidota bacterium]